MGAEHGDRVFEPGDRINVSEIAGCAADKDTPATDVRRIQVRRANLHIPECWRRILPEDQWDASNHEIVTFHSSFQVAIIVFVRRSTAASGVSTFSEWEGRCSPQLAVVHRQLLGGTLLVSFDSEQTAQGRSRVPGPLVYLD
jgi:hypothetical protein